MMTKTIEVSDEELSAIISTLRFRADSILPSSFLFHLVAVYNALANRLESVLVEGNHG